MKIFWAIWTFAYSWLFNFERCFLQSSLFDNQKQSHKTKAEKNADIRFYDYFEIWVSAQNICFILLHAREIWKRSFIGCSSAWGRSNNNKTFIKFLFILVCSVWCYTFSVALVYVTICYFWWNLLFSLKFQSSWNWK